MPSTAPLWNDTASTLHAPSTGYFTFWCCFIGTQLLVQCLTNAIATLPLVVFHFTLHAIFYFTLLAIFLDMHSIDLLNAVSLLALHSTRLLFLKHTANPSINTYASLYLKCRPTHVFFIRWSNRTPSSPAQSNEMLPNIWTAKSPVAFRNQFNKHWVSSDEFSTKWLLQCPESDSMLSVFLLCVIFLFYSWRRVHSL